MQKLLKIGIFVLLCIVLVSVNLALAPNSIDLVSRSSTGEQGNGNSHAGSLSHDGRYLAFYSTATNLSLDDNDTLVDLYLRDLSTGVTIHVAPITTVVRPGIAIAKAQISGDGQWIVFPSQANLSPDDLNTNVLDIYLYNVAAETFQLISSGSVTSANANNPTVSYDGHYVAYDEAWTVYYYDRIADTSDIISADALDPYLSGDGEYMVYAEYSSRNLYLYEHSSGISQLIAGGRNVEPVISADASLIAYTHYPTSTFTPSTVNTYDRLTGEIRTLTVYSTTPPGYQRSFQPALPADGSYVIFGSFADEFVPGPDTVSGDIFAYDMATGTIERLSLLTDGSEPDYRSDVAFISGNGLYIGFQSDATNYVDVDINGFGDLFIGEYDLVNSPIPYGDPVFSSDPLPGSTITRTGFAETPVTATLSISNTGDTFSQLDVTQIGALNNFTISALPTGLTPEDGLFDVIIGCTIPSSGSISETLTLETNEPGNPQYTYTLVCDALDAMYSSNPAIGSTFSFAGLPQDIVSTTFTISNTGDIGSLLDVSILSIPTGFSISELPLDLGAFDPPYEVTINCDVDMAVNGSLSLTTNDPANPVVSYPLECEALLPDYDSTPVAASTITLTGLPGAMESTTLSISNTGDSGTELDVTQIGILNDFTISALPAGLTPEDGAFDVTIGCTIPSSGSISETLTLQSNEPGNPQYTYTLVCDALDATYSSNPVVGSTFSFAGLPQDIVSTTFTISNIGDIGSLLDVSLLSIPTGFSISELPLDLETNALPYEVTISCDVDMAVNGSLSLITNDPGNPLVTYPLVCEALEPPPEVTPEPTPLPDRVTICHIAGRGDNPAHYQVLELPVAALNGHFDNNGTPRAGHEKDFIIETDADLERCSPD